MTIRPYENDTLFTELESDAPNLAKATLGLGLAGFFTSWPVQPNWTVRILERRVKTGDKERNRYDHL